MKAPKAPITMAPDPVATANAQTASNRETAIANANINRVDQYTPDGSITYNQTGVWSDGTPRYASTTTLSPEQQATRAQELEFDRKFNEIGLAQTNKIGDTLSKPFALGNEAVEGRITELASKRLNPRFAEEEQKLEQDLMNRGIRPGSAAYDTMRRQFSEGKNDAFNQMYLNARGQANTELLTERNQPINEITALLSGGQVSQPQFNNVPQANVAGTDIAGMTYDSAAMNNANAMARYNAKNANYQAGMGGLFGLGSALIGGGARMFTGGRSGGGTGGLY
jgi:hypothetical protein